MQKKQTSPIKALISLKKMDRPLFIPFLYTYAAKLEQIPVRRLLTNPAALTRGLSQAYKLFQYDAITLPFDTTLEAEALGCKIAWQPEALPALASHAPAAATTLDSMTGKARIPVVLEALTRIQTQYGKETDILVGITGPLTLARQLGGEKFSASFLSGTAEALDLLEFSNLAVSALAREYGEKNPDGIILIEEAFFPGNEGSTDRLKPFYRSLANIFSFYELPFMLYTDHHLPDDRLAELFDLAGDGLIIPAPSGLKKFMARSLKQGKGLGAALPLKSWPDKSEDDFIKLLKKFIAEGGNKGFFISSDGEIPFSMPPEILHRLMNVLKESRKT